MSEKGEKLFSVEEMQRLAIIVSLASQHEEGPYYVFTDRIFNMGDKEVDIDLSAMEKRLRDLLIEKIFYEFFELAQRYKRDVAAWYFVLLAGQLLELDCQGLACKLDELCEEVDLVACIFGPVEAIEVA